MLVLITNDDGIQAFGLRALAKEMSKLGRVLIVAPDREQSATSHALTLHRPLRLNKLAGNVYSVDGTPTDAVMIAVHGILKHRRPDILLSGINHGPNMGDDVTYSGTVAAAIEGTLLGIPSLAISYALGAVRRNSLALRDFALPARIARTVALRMLKHLLPSGTFLNVNIPWVKNGKLRGCEITRLGSRVFNDIIIAKTDPRGKRYYWIGGEPTWKAKTRSDFSALQKKKVSITPLKTDLTNYEALPGLASWRLPL